MNTNTPLNYTCTTSTALVYSLRGEASGYGRWWANITIREWEEGGSIDVQSDMGTLPQKSQKRSAQLLADSMAMRLRRVE